MPDDGDLDDDDCDADDYDDDGDLDDKNDDGGEDEHDDDDDLDDDLDDGGDLMDAVVAISTPPLSFSTRPTDVQAPNCLIMVIRNMIMV